MPDQNFLNSANKILDEEKISDKGERIEKVIREVKKAGEKGAQMAKEAKSRFDKTDAKTKKTILAIGLGALALGILAIMQGRCRQKNEDTE